MNSTVHSGLLIAGKNLSLERRAGEVLLVTAPFGAVAMWIVPMAVGTDIPLLRSLGPGVFWVVVLLFGVLVPLRQSTIESRSQAALLTLAGVPGAVRLLGGALASAALLVAFQALLVPVAVLLYDPPLWGWPWLLGLLPTMAVGLALFGAVADALLHPVGVRSTLGPLLVIPLSIPLLLGATQTMAAAAAGRSPLSWFLLVVLVDLVLFLAALLVGHVMESS